MRRPNVGRSFLGENLREGGKTQEKDRSRTAQRGIAGPGDQQVQVSGALCYDCTSAKRCSHSLTSARMASWLAAYATVASDSSSDPELRRARSGCG